MHCSQTDHLTVFDFCFYPELEHVLIICFFDRSSLSTYAIQKKGFQRSRQKWGLMECYGHQHRIGWILFTDHGFTQLYYMSAWINELLFPL